MKPEGAYYESEALGMKAKDLTFHQYKRTQIAELAFWQPEAEMEGVSISDADLAQDSPRMGDMIARNPKDHGDMWLVSESYFQDNFDTMEPYYCASGDHWVAEAVSILTGFAGETEYICGNCTDKEFAVMERTVADLEATLAEYRLALERIADMGRLTWPEWETKYGDVTSEPADIALNALEEKSSKEKAFEAGIERPSNA